MPGDSEVIDTNRYIIQIEKRLLEQESLIALLKEKIASLEGCSGGAGADHGARDGGSKLMRSSGVRGMALTLVGSKKTSLSSIQSVGCCRIFATRLDPAISAADMAKDLLKDVDGLKHVKCYKMKTRHATYSSFHVEIPEDQRDLLFIEAAWPEGALVKEFEGILLKSHIVESYDSETNESKTFSIHQSSKNKPVDSQRKTLPPAKKTTSRPSDTIPQKTIINKAKPVDKSSASVSHGSPTSSSKDPATTAKNSSSSRRDSRSATTEAAQTSPKNLRSQRGTKNH